VNNDKKVLMRGGSTKHRKWGMGLQSAMGRKVSRKANALKLNC
jgi:hypothetical protein